MASGARRFLGAAELARPLPGPTKVGPDACRLINQRTGGTIAHPVEIAATSRTRRRGLLGRTGLDPSWALVIAPCAAIHTAFMQFPIDVAFVARDGRVLKIVRSIGPWRMAAAFGAYAAIEMAAGSLDANLAVGDVVALTSR